MFNRARSRVAPQPNRDFVGENNNNKNITDRLLPRRSRLNFPQN